MNKIFNSKDHYGWVSILLHWSMAIALIGMYFLGDYMVELDYYDTGYHQAPALHKAIGAVLGMSIIFRLLWNLLQSKPTPLDDKPLLITLAKLGHYALYALVILLLISGYLISTAKGQGIDVFGLFQFPALLPENENLAEIAGEAHQLIGSVFFIMVMLHAGAALVHHFIFNDRTLTRMLWVRKSRENH